MKNSTSWSLYLLLAGVLAFIGVSLQLFSTRWGSGISPDSSTYISTARNLLDGQGFTFPAGDGSAIPLTLWPPLFPLLLAIPGALGVDPLLSARWINSLLYAGNILLIGLLVYSYTRGSLLAAILGSFLFLISVDMLTIHSWTWSEPLFIFFGFVGIYSLARYIQKPRLLAFLVAGISIGLAAAARYAGVAFIAAGSVALLSLGKHRSRTERLGSAAGFAVLGSIPLGVWLLRNQVAIGSATNRQIRYQPLNTSHLRQALEATSRWFMPEGIMGNLRDSGMLVIFIGLIALLLFGVWYDRRQHKVRSSDSPLDSETYRFPWLILFFMITYALVLSFTKAFVDPDLPFNNRLLSPLYAMGLVLGLNLVFGFYVWVKSSKTTSPSQSGGLARSQVLMILLVSIFGYLTVLSLTSELSWVNRAYARGLGYASKSWHETELITLIDSLPQGTPIYSNAPDAITVLTERPAYMLPAKGTSEIDPNNPLYPSEFATMSRILERKAGVIAYFNQITWRNLLTGSELEAILPLRILLRTHEGSIYSFE